MSVPSPSRFYHALSECIRKLTHGRYGSSVSTVGRLAEDMHVCFKSCPTHSGGNMEPITSKIDHHHSHLVDPERMRRVMGRFASGVTIITTRYDGCDYGLTASAVSSLSL